MLKKTVFAALGLLAMAYAGGACAQASAVGGRTAERLMPPAATSADVTNLTNTVNELSNQILKGGGAKQIFSGEYYGAEVISFKNNSGAALVINFDGSATNNTLAYVTDSAGNYYDFARRGDTGEAPKIVATVPGSVTTVYLTSTRGEYRNMRITALSSMALDSDFVLSFLYTDVVAGSCSVQPYESCSTDQISGITSCGTVPLRTKPAYKRTFRSGLIQYGSQGSDELRPVTLFGSSYSNLAALIKNDYAFNSGGQAVVSVACSP